jgi:drug/metabolite transporter (DMT)-like permease
VSKRGWVLFAALGIIWGIPYLLIKVADEGVSVPVLVWARVTIGAAILVPVAIIRRRPGDVQLIKTHARWPVAFALAEIIAPWALLSQAERRLPSGTTGLLIAAVPVIGALLAMAPTRRPFPLHSERLTKLRWAGLLIGFGGVALLAVERAGWVGGGGGDLPSILLVLVVAVCYAIGPMIANTKLTAIPPITVNAVCLSFAAIVYSPFAALTWPSVLPTARVLASLATLGAVCTATALVLLFLLVAEVGPARAVVITYINPAVAVALGALVLGETVTPVTIVSFVAILGGSVLATALKRQPAPTSSPADLAGPRTPAH